MFILFHFDPCFCSLYYAFFPNMIHLFSYRAGLHFSIIVNTSFFVFVVTLSYLFPSWSIFVLFFISRSFMSGTNHYVDFTKVLLPIYFMLHRTFASCLLYMNIFLGHHLNWIRLLIIKYRHHHHLHHHHYNNHNHHHHHHYHL